MSDPTVSIIVCTRDRADDLRQTLAAMARVRVPPEMPTELLVVDNGSTDGTARVAQDCRLPDTPVRYVREPRAGKGHAYNTGMAAARGRVFLFTDDDVRPPENWIAGMCGPILAGQADALAGGVEMAPSLARPWMTAEHRKLLACTDSLDADRPAAMIGANMAFGRHVLARVPGFDTELGPGALGFFDDVLFSSQVREAGFRLGSALGVVNEHRFDPARLSRASFLDRARKEGRSLAYFVYHWEHGAVPAPRLQIARRLLRLAQWRVTRRRDLGPEGVPDWEFWLLRDLAFHRQYLRESRRPRLYAPRGLIKRSP